MTIIVSEQNSSSSTHNSQTKPAHNALSVTERTQQSSSVSSNHSSSDISNKHGNDDLRPQQDEEEGRTSAMEGLSTDDEEEQEQQRLQQQKQRNCACYKKLFIASVLVAIVVFVIVDSLTNMYVRDGVNSFLEWIQQNPGPGVVAFAVVYFVATVLFVPGSILTLGSGFVFSASFGLGIGVLLGTLAVFVGASAGAIVSFLLGRYLLRSPVKKLSEKYSIFEALDNALESKGFRIMVLLRLSPIIPFNAINYIAGVSALKFMSYIWAMFAILPGTILYVFLGASAGSLADSAMSGDNNTTVTIVVVVLGVFFGVIAIALTSYYAKQELNKVIEQRQAELNDDDDDIVADGDVEQAEAQTHETKSSQIDDGDNELTSNTTDVHVH